VVFDDNCKLVYDFFNVLTEYTIYLEIIESDDIRLIEQEINHANNYLNKVRLFISTINCSLVFLDFNLFITTPSFLFRL